MIAESKVQDYGRKQRKGKLQMNVQGKTATYFKV